MFITIKKKTVILTLVLVVVVISAYLNFKSPNHGETMTVMSDSSAQEVRTGEAIMVSAETNTIIEAKNNREIVRSKACELLSKTMKDSTVSSDAKQKAESMLLDMAEAIDLENECESILKAKGFGECVVFISSDSANVTVIKSEITDIDTAKINDIISSVAKIKDVKIINLG